MICIIRLKEGGGGFESLHRKANPIMDKNLEKLTHHFGFESKYFTQRH